MGTRAIELNDWLKFTAVGSPRVSPDGKWVSFHVSTSNMEDNRNETAIWLYDMKSGQSRQLTHGPKDGEAAWAPDSSQLAFISSRDGKDQIYVIRPDGGEAMSLSSELESPAHLTWSPDGTSLAVTVLVAENEQALTDIAGALSDNGSAEDIFSNQKKSHLRISGRFPFRFDGIGYFDGQRRHLVQLKLSQDRAELVQITRGEFDVQSYAWTPGGHALTYSTQKSVDDLHGSMIFEVSLETLIAREFLDPNGGVVSLSWAPNGQYLAWIGDDGSHGWGTENNVWLLDVSRGVVSNLTASLDRPVGEVPHGDVRGYEGLAAVQWSADSRRLYVEVHVNGIGMLYGIDALTGDANPLLEPWTGVAHSPSLSRDAVYFAGEDFYHPTELFRVSLSEGQVEQLTHLNQKLLEEVELGRFEHYVIKRGEFSIEGFVGSPASTEEKAPLPAILYIHGGPHGAFGQVFRHEYFVEMARGRRIIFVNPRGSQGYGQEFAKACMQDWGGEDFQDIMEFLDMVIEKGLIAKDKIGITGISYGGYMTNWAITHTSRFRAAISEMSVSNHLSMYTHSDIGPDFMRSELGGAPWEEWELLWERSPIRYAAQVTTPTLFIAGQEDYRCPAEQSEAMYVALLRRHIPTALVTFPKAAHGFSVTGVPEARLERRRLMAAWWERYLL